MKNKEGIRLIHKVRYTTQEYFSLLREFQDLVNSDPKFNYSYSEFNKWVLEVVQGDKNK